MIVFMNCVVSLISYSEPYLCDFVLHIFLILVFFLKKKVINALPFKACLKENVEKCLLLSDVG